MLFGIFSMSAFKTFALSLRGARKHKARGLRSVSKAHTAHEVSGSQGVCRQFHGLDNAPNLTQGFAFGSALGFMPLSLPRSLLERRISRVA
jgi:hypothetical protein